MKKDNHFFRFITALAEKIAATFTQKRLLLIIGLCFVFYASLPFQENLFEKYLLLKEDTAFPFWLDMSTFLLVIGLSYFWFIRIWQFDYRASFAQFLSITVISIVILYPLLFKQEEWNWEYLKMAGINIPYVYIIAIPGLVFVATAVVKLIQLTYQKTIKEEKHRPRDNYESDQPLNYQDEAAADYKTLLEELKDAIVYKDKPEAFSIGIVGPWGIGKSSLLGLLKQRLKPSKNIWQRLGHYFAIPEEERGEPKRSGTGILFIA